MKYIKYRYFLFYKTSIKKAAVVRVLGNRAVSSKPYHSWSQGPGSWQVLAQDGSNLLWPHPYKSRYYATLWALSL